jgi:hypothetical protein
VAVVADFVAGLAYGCGDLGKAIRVGADLKERRGNIVVL